MGEGIGVHCGDPRGVDEISPLAQVMDAPCRVADAVAAQFMRGARCQAQQINQACNLRLGRGRTGRKVRVRSFPLGRRGGGTPGGLFICGGYWITSLPASSQSSTSSRLRNRWVAEPSLTPNTGAPRSSVTLKMAPASEHLAAMLSRAWRSASGSNAVGQLGNCGLCACGLLRPSPARRAWRGAG